MTVEKGGFDLWFEVPGIADGCSIDITSNVIITTGSEPTTATASIERSGSTYYLSVYSEGVLYETFTTTISTPKKVRWCMHNEFLSCYVNENWVHTFYFRNIDYPEYEDMVVSITSSGSPMELTNVVLVDLYDWREAIFIDLDSVAANAVSSVIQQRPVEIRPTHLGEVRFHYSADEKRDVVNLYQKLITTVSKVNNPNQVVSDAIVYGSEVEILTSEDSASHHGFITRIIRVPELDTGARRAAKEMIKKAEQQSIMYTISLRADIRIETGDLLQCSYHLSSTNTYVEVSCIVESVVVNMRNATFSMIITGRNYAA
jgi:hypothetical protein